MFSAHTYKALIISLLCSCAIIYLGFTVHVKKQTQLVAETFYELDTKPEEKQEDIDDVMKSLDKLLTNKAFNQTKQVDEYDDKAFKERLKALRERQENNAKIPNANDEDVDNSLLKEIKDTKYDSINNIIKKRSLKEQEDHINVKESSIRYSLKDRTHKFLPKPIYLCNKGGKIVINIFVNNEGRVIKADYNNSSTSKNGCLIDHALEYAKVSRFNADSNKDTQLGTITFYFKPKE